LLIFISKLAIAQGENSNELNFKHISYKEGLVQSPISNFLQDDKGFIWFGNFKGLTRYDGYEFKTFIFNEHDRNSISSNRVNNIIQDSDKNLWVGTANGLNLYDRNRETFKAIDLREIKGGRNYISSLVEDHQKNIWVGTFGGLKRLNRKTEKLEDIATLSTFETLGSEAVFSLFLDKENKIWAGTKSGLRKFDPKTGKIIPLPAIFNSVQDFATSKVLVTRQDHQGNLWFGTETSGVFNYKKNGNMLIRYVY
jgi:sugar lactone lactonase YvrE